MSFLKKYVLKNMSQGDPKYFEIWGLYEAWFRHSRLIIVFLCFMVLFMGTGLLLTYRKPPALIVVDDLGKAAYIENYLSSEQAPKDPEIRYFIKNFVENYSAPNSERIYDQMADAMNMMTPSFMEVHKEEIKDNDVIEKIVNAKIKTSLEFKDIQLEKGSESIFATVLGISEVFPLGSLQSDPKRNGFRIQLRLAFCPRTETAPHGILVDDYSIKTVSLVTVDGGKDFEVPVEVEEQ